MGSFAVLVGQLSGSLGVKFPGSACLLSLVINTIVPSGTGQEMAIPAHCLGLVQGCPPPEASRPISQQGREDWLPSLHSLIGAVAPTQFDDDGRRKSTPPAWTETALY